MLLSKVHARQRVVCGCILTMLLLGACTSPEAARRWHEFTGMGDSAVAMPPPEQETPTTVEAGVAERGAGLEPVGGPALEPRDQGGSALVVPEIFPGSGETVQLGVVDSSQTPEELTDEAEVTLNFVNADIRQVIDAVLGETLNLPYVVDPRVQGKITLRTTGPMSRHNVLGVLEQALVLNAAALVFTDGIYKIVPAEAGVQSPNMLGHVRLDRGFGLYIIPLRFTNATAMEELVKTFVAPGRSLRADPQHNVLTFVGAGSEAQDLADLVATFDVDRMQGKSFGLYPLNHVSPQTLIEELDRVFSQNSKTPEKALVEFVPIQHLNALLAISSNATRLEQVKAWVARLDRGVAGKKRQLYIYYVQNGRAAELANVLGQVLGVKVVTAAKVDDAPELAPGLTPTTIQSGASSGYDASLDASGVSQDSETTTEQDAALRAIDEAAGLPASEAIQHDTNDGASDKPLQIVASERNNALVVYASAEEYATIEAALSKLDIVPLQVLIEATIAEVTLNDTLRYGIEWYFNQGQSEVTLSTLVSGAVASAFPGFSYVLNMTDAHAVLNALSRVTDVKVVSAPQLMVLDNEKATLKVGDQVPIVKKTAVSITDPDAPVVNEVEYRDTGVILSIVPRVNASGLVVLDVLQEVSDVTATTSSGIDSPTIQQRRIASTVAVNSGETVALGGLIRDTKTISNSGVPLLKDIPVLGNLFGSTSDEMRRTELLVLIKPRVISNRSDARIVTEYLRGRLTPGLPTP